MTSCVTHSAILLKITTIFREIMMLAAIVMLINCCKYANAILCLKYNKLYMNARSLRMVWNRFWRSIKNTFRKLQQRSEFNILLLVYQTHLGENLYSKRKNSTIYTRKRRNTELPTKHAMRKISGSNPAAEACRIKFRKISVTYSKT